MIGDGFCRDAFGEIPPYCDPKDENQASILSLVENQDDISSLVECQRVCIESLGCQAIAYGDDSGCRVYFDSNRLTGWLALSTRGVDCEFGPGGKISIVDAGESTCHTYSSNATFILNSRMWKNKLKIGMKQVQT